MIKVKFYIGVSCLFLFTACLQVNDISSVEHKFSINCLFSSDSSWLLNVRKADVYGPFPDKHFFVRDAQGLTFPFEWNQSLGCYDLKLKKPQHGNLYELWQTDSEKSQLLSESKIPPVAEIKNERAFKIKNQTKIEFDLLCNDAVPYYSIQVCLQKADSKIVIPIERVDIESKNIISGMSHSYVVIGNEQLKEGPRLVICISNCCIVENNPLVLTVKSCSKEAGLYLSTRQLYAEGIASMIYSNIKGELGIWGGYVDKSYLIFVDKL